MSLSLPATTFDAAAPAPHDGPAAAAPRGRASWSGLLRLSLVAVPVKAYPATSTTPEHRCHQLHAGCGQRIRYEKHCPRHGKVEAGAIVSGYPVCKNSRPNVTAESHIACRLSRLISFSGCRSCQQSKTEFHENVVRTNIRPEFTQVGESPCRF